MDVLEEKNGADTELLMFTMTLINKVKKPKTDANIQFYKQTTSL